MDKDNILERKLLAKGGLDVFEEELKSKIDQEIEEARKEREKMANREENKVIIKDFSKVDKDKRFDTSTFYKVFNRKQKTETFVNGEQAENMLQYPDDYVVRFDHRVEYR